jgi:tRNA(Ile)-lysidine synthase
MDEFLKNMRQAIADYQMLQPGEAVQVAFSGGADSTALLLGLQELGYAVSACHLHHGLRGAEANRDAAFCEALCSRLGVPFVLRHANAAAYAAQTHESVETAARVLRYAFFAEAANGCKTATAHTANDNLETMLFHLARGTGLQGLCGIPPVRGDIIRPLILCTRVQAEAFLAVRGQGFVTDSTNLSDIYTRNRIRHGVVPVLEALNPAAADAAAGLAARLRQDEACLAGQASALLDAAARQGGWLVQPLHGAHPAVRTRALRQACAHSGVPARDFTARHTAALEGLLQAASPSAKADLPGGFAAWREYDLLKIGRWQAPSGYLEQKISIPFDGSLGAGMARVRISRTSKKVFYKSFNTFYANCDTIDMATLVLRTRRTGDRLRPHANSGSKTLKKLMIDRKIPSAQRSRLCVLADKNGIIAVQSIGMDASRCQSGSDVYEIRFEG